MSTILIDNGDGTCSAVDGGQLPDGAKILKVLEPPYVAVLETRTFIIDATGDRSVLTAGVKIPIITELMKFNDFPVGAKKCRIDLHFPEGVVPFAHAFLASINCGSGTGDDAIAISRLSVANFAPGDVDAGDTAQRCASATVPTIQWDVDLFDAEEIIENLYVHPIFLGGSGVGTVVGIISIW